ncbi:MAG TPA: DUF423 domain-containing protein [Bryobacteraceae bacterium]|jgi:uncharacterized membrane protein YgdD (TMEM256/DUF423 family)
MNWGVTGAFLLALAVVFGAFGAHGLRGKLDDYSMGVYEKAVFYHFIHALGLLIVAFLPKTGTFSEFATSVVCWLLLIGIIIFSGSLYALAITRTTWLGAITPIGGVAFIAGWLALAWFLMRR